MLNSKKFLLPRPTSFGFLAIIFAILFSFSATPSTRVFAKDNLAGATSQLQNSVRRLNVWLGGSNDAVAWRRFLMLNVLETQTAKGDQADIQTLLAIRNRFSQDNSGLKHPAFADVKLALDAQINRLGSRMPGDLRYAVLQAQGQYKPISVASMAYQRDLAVYELGLLKKYYRRTLSSRDRAEIFYDIELDQSIEFLQGMKFELAPEISAGKIASMIRDVQGNFNDVEKELDALPITPEPDDDDETDKQDPIEPAIGDGLPELGPIPDGGQKSKEELEREMKTLAAKIKLLKEQRMGIRSEDKPRRDARSKTFSRLLALQANFVEASKTLKDPYFVSAAMTIEQFVRTFYYGTGDNLQEEFIRKLEEIGDNIDDVSGDESRTAFGQLGENLRWLENTNQVPGLVASIRAKYSNPNIYVGISGKLINRIGAQNVATVQRIRENVGGRLVRGTARIDATVRVELQDDPNQIRANIRLAGDLDSSVYLEQSGVQVFTGINGKLEAVRTIYANIGGLFASDPKVAANISASFSGTSSRLKLINKFAAKKFAEVKGESEGTTARTSESQLQEQFGPQTDEILVTGQKGLRDAQDALAANANLAPQLYLRSTNSQVVLVGKKSSIGTLAAPDYPIAFTVPTDISVRVHETLLSNFLDRAFSGKTFTDTELAEQIGEMMGGDAPAAFGPAEGEEGEDTSFSITFDTVRPIQFEFDNNGLGVSIAGRRFAKDDMKISTGLRIGLRFKIKRVEGKLKLVRDGKATLEYVGEKKDVKAVAFRSFLDGRLNPKEDGQQIAVDLPENLLPIDQIEPLKDSEIAKQMQLVQCRSESGWLYLGWNHQPANANFAWQMDIPAIWTEATIYEMSPSYIEGVVEESVLTIPQQAVGMPVLEGSKP